MRRVVALLVFGLLLPAGARAAAASHEIRVHLDPSTHSLQVVDVIAVGDASPRTLRFLLHAGLQPTTETAGAELRKLDRPPQAADFGLPPDRLPAPRVPVELWEARLSEGTASLSLSFGGVLDHPVQPAPEEQARGFAETPGTIGPEGVVLTGASLWIPWMGGDPFPFVLTVALPGGWDAVSQGRRTRHERDAQATEVVWDSPEPQVEVTLVAGRFEETSRTAGKMSTHAFLLERDDTLAAKYLDATERYLRMYGDLLGPHPYPKFALVENFWETGYGMPSYTLLGSKVIRLPFLLNTSYPHEILHDWWGNGVYVDAAAGNWSEGLTAYLADHLLQEQSGDASEYRQSALQRYADYVTKSKDFPLAEFRERHSPASEAVGYGRAMMLFHETRLALGDAAFVAGLRRFYDEQRFREASFDTLRRALEAASGRNLSDTFSQALGRTGAPELALRRVEAVLEPEGGWIVRGVLAQQQDGKPYLLDVPLAVTLEGVPAAFETTVRTTGGSTRFELRVPARPLRLDADPVFDLFRRLDPAEAPPALSRALGAERVLALLPSAEAPAMQEAYRALAQALAPEPGRLQVRMDAEVRALPSDRTVWVLGWQNRHRAEVAGALSSYGAEVSEDSVVFPELSRRRGGLAVVAVAAHPKDGARALAWVAGDRVAQLPGLARKLPHYGKYSWLAFEGDEPTNMGKGRWPVLRSPLTAVLAEGPPPARAALSPRTPLAVPPSEVPTEGLGRVVRALAAPEMEGRAPGSQGHARAAAFVEQEMRAAGLAPATVAGNVVGRIAGTRPEWKDQVVVVGAHFDHLGKEGGALHPGADDNASGIAALLALARVFATGEPPERTLLFAAFDGEESGRLGSKRLAAELAREGTQVFAMVNLDSVGRLGTGKLLVLGTGTASEWPHVFRGAGFVTGVPVEPVAADPGGSDQVSFQEAGVPAVQLFTGAHGDWHKPSDTPDKVDLPGIAKVVAVAREAVQYLAGRPEPLTRQGERPAGTSEPGGGRRAALGTIPDFAFAGPGVRLGGVVAGSAAEREGLAEGDVLVELNGQALPDLRAYSEALKHVAPGDRVRLTYVRGEERLTVELEAAPR